MVLVDESDGQGVDDGVKGARGADEKIVQSHVLRQHHGGRGEDEEVEGGSPDGPRRNAGHQTIHQ